MKNIAILSMLLTISACGIDVKTPKEMDLRVNLDAKDLAKQAKQYSNNKTPPQYLKFLKDQGLRAYVLAQEATLKGRCLVPSRTAVNGEHQGDNYLFAIHQKCYIADNGYNKSYLAEFDIVGFLNTASLKYELLLEDKPEVQVTEISAEEFKSAMTTGHFIHP